MGTRGIVTNCRCPASSAKTSIDHLMRGLSLSFATDDGKTSPRDSITKVSEQWAGSAGLLRQDPESSVGLSEQDSMCMLP